MNAVSLRLLRELFSAFPSLQSVLVISGSPCVGFSFAKTVAEGTMDKESRLIACMPAVLAVLREVCPASAHIFFLFENVPMNANEYVKACVPLIDKAVGVTSVLIDSKLLSATSRERRYWTNLAVHPITPQEVQVCQHLPSGWRPLWEFPGASPKPDLRFGTFTRGFAVGQPPEVPAPLKAFERYPLHAYHDRLLVYDSSASSSSLQSLTHWTKTSIRINTKSLRHPGDPSIQRRGLLAEWIHRKDGHQIVRPLSCRERELIMGFPAGASALPADELHHGFFNLEQSRATGNAFNVHVVRHLLGPYASFVHGNIEASAALTSGWSKELLPVTTCFDTVLRSIQPSTAPPASGGRSR